ncbi:hypothetical protein OKE68_10875, partial [Riemerella anatipestifer]
LCLSVSVCVYEIIWNSQIIRVFFYICLYVVGIVCHKTKANLLPFIEVCKFLDMIYVKNKKILPQK